MPNVAQLAPLVFWILIAITVLSALAAAIQKQWFDSSLASLVTLAFLLPYWIIDPSDSFAFVFRTSGIFAFTGLNLTLLIGPWSRFSKRILPLYKHRRHIGVTTFFLAWLHGSFILGSYFQYDYRIAFESPFTFFGVSALFILIMLAVTSFDKIQKKVTLKQWRVVHLLSLLAYIYLLYDFWKASEGSISLTHSFVILVFLLFWIAVSPWRVKESAYVLGWKRLHILVYIAYASVIVHVVSGPLSFAPQWMEVGFWAIIAITVGSHLTGHVMRIKEYREKKKNMRPHITESDKKYFLLDDISSFEEGSGRRFDIEGTDIAAFLQEGKVYAMSNICPHQGGPLCEGAIVKGFVECPWHQWQFGVKDGMSPKEFNDCIPYFDVIEKDGQAWMNLEDKNKDKDCH